MTIFRHAPITWTADTKTDAACFNQEIKEKMDDIDAKFVVSKARAYLSAIQLNIPNNTVTKVLLNTESYDIGSNFDIVNSKFVAPVTGYYLICGGISWKIDIAGKKCGLYIYKNGVPICGSQTCSTNVDDMLCNVSDIQYLTVGDYIELYAYHYAGANLDIYGGGSSTFMAVHLLST